VLATTVVAASALHIWWLHHLIAEPLLAAWFALLALMMLALLAYRWVWRPAEPRGAATWCTRYGRRRRRR
jgi:hypothetical protein